MFLIGQYRVVAMHFYSIDDRIEQTFLQDSVDIRSDSPENLLRRFEDVNDEESDKEIDVHVE